MRNGSGALACALLLAGCASGPEPAEVALTEPAANVIVYDIAPPNAQTLGPVQASACNGTREIATRQLQNLAARQGGNGLTQLVCRDEGFSLRCLSSTACTAVAVLVPPPQPPPAPPPRRRKR
ncbi:MAG: hypothetical protein Q8M26_04055 [Pseudolabrys sp.]|nr:hypothetical protein [Pseudolabrys sp.]